MVTFTVAATLAFYYPRIAIILYPLAALVGLSRVYLGSHYPSDVVAGAFLGIGFTYLLTRNIIVERWRECLLLTAAVVLAYFKLGGFILFDVDEADPRTKALHDFHGPHADEGAGTPGFWSGPKTETPGPGEAGKQ